MFRNCEKCGSRYDDADQTTICPHELIMAEVDLEQKKLGLSLLGTRVRFRHMEEGAQNFKVVGCGWNGMVVLGGMPAVYILHMSHIYLNVYTIYIQICIYIHYLYDVGDVYI